MNHNTSKQMEDFSKQILRGLHLLQDLKLETRPKEEQSLADTDHMPRVITELGELPPAAIINKEAISIILNKHSVSIDRMIN